MRSYIVALSVVALIFVWLASSIASDNTSLNTGPILEGGRLVDRDARYSFALPAGWSLAPAPSSSRAKVVHLASGADFVVAIKPEVSDDLEAEFKGLKLALPFIGGKWSKVSDGWRKVGGQRAGEVVAIRTYPNADPLKQWDLVVIYQHRAYILEGEVPQPQVDARWQDLASILKSFEWAK